MDYPKTRKVDHIDDYHGTRVADPYRWLEDDLAPDTIAWVEAQNALTRSVLDGDAREAIRARLVELYNYPRTGLPQKRGRRYFFTYNTGLQNQPVLYTREDAGDPCVLLDPNALASDGTVALTALEADDSGALIAYGLSKSGSDVQEIRVRDVDAGHDRADLLEWVKFATIAWLRDSSGFYYTRFPAPGTVAAGDEHYFQKVCFHRIGDAQDRDRLIYERADDKEIVFTVDLSDDDRYLVISSYRGSSDKSEIHVVDRHAADPVPKPLVTGFTSAYELIDAARGRLFFKTDDEAPLGRVVAVDPAASPLHMSEVVAESSDKLSLTAIVHDRLVLSYLHNASDRVRLFTLDGLPDGDVALPALGSIVGFSGRPADDELLLSFTSFTYPTTAFRFDFGTRVLERFEPGLTAFAKATAVRRRFMRRRKAGTTTQLEPRPADYETHQVWYPSKDGTRISMFLVHRKGLKIDGTCPVLLTGYGGFNISLTPAFDPANFVFYDRGGLYAVANLRGGGEYGDAWHQAGMFERKQNVFDDFIAAAEWLIANRYTTSRRLAIEGGSNGGLLVGAMLVQRPDLFGAAICRVPVADMLRYHRFTVGRFWISEYGSADDPAQFPYLLAYSPYHNVKDGTAYPATLVMTADTDDRVAPGMAKKFAARLQASASTAREGGPILIRVERKAGHGAGKPVTKMIDEDADIFTFLDRFNVRERSRGRQRSTSRSHGRIDRDS